MQPPQQVFFRCSKCSYQTEFQDLLDRHISKHSLVQPLQCPECDFSDLDSSTFVDHWVSHRNTKVIKCSFCSFKCQCSAQLKRHIPKHRTVELLDCSHCEFSSNYVHSMKNHIETYHSKLYPCDLCQGIMTKYELAKHSKEVHGADTQHPVEESVGFPAGMTKPRDSLQESKPAIDKEGSGFGCAELNHLYCNCSPQEPMPSLAIKTEPQLSPKLEADVLQCSLCEFTAANDFSLKYHRVVFHKKPFSCTHCSEIMTRHEMIQHSLIAHGVKFSAQPVVKNDVVGSDESEHSETEESVPTPERLPATSIGTFQCPYCSYSSRRTRWLESHIFRLHSKKYSCEMCSVALTKYELIGHYANVHRVERSIFSRNLKQDLADVAVEALISADRVGRPDVECNPCSEDAKLLRCSFCGYFSTKNVLLNDHIVEFHEKAHSCNHCDKVMTKHELIEHYQVAHGSTSSDFQHKEANQSSVENAEVNTKASGPSSYRLPNPNSHGRYECSICMFTSGSKHGHELHYHRFHLKKYACPRCEIVMTKHSLIRHAKEEHGVDMKVRGAGWLAVEDTINQTEGTSEFLSNMVENPKARELKSASPEEPSIPPPLECSLESERHAKLFQCYDCSYETKIKSQMRRHVSVHLPEGNFVCPDCDFSSKKTATFARHVLTHNVRKGSFKCCFCTFKTKAWKGFKFHIKSYRPIGRLNRSESPDQSPPAKRILPDKRVLFRCSECKMSGSKRRIALHIRRNHPSSTFSRKRLRPKLNQKQLQHSKMKPSRGKLSLRQMNAAVVTGKGKLLQCKACDYETAIDDLLRRHEAKHAPLQCPICELKCLSGYSFANHLKGHNPSTSPYRCFYCGHQSNHFTNLYSHLSTHVEAIKKHDCSMCEFSSWRPDELRRHNINRHSSTLIAPCTRGSGPRKDCASAVQSKKYVSIPIDLDPPKYASKLVLLQCHDCPYQTRMKSLMRQHVKLHLPEGQLECIKCAFKANSSLSFAKHLKSHVTPGRAVNCCFCDFSSHTTSVLKHHLHRHRNVGTYYCSKCEFSCALPHSLAKHTQLHHVDKFACPGCNKVASRFSIVRHFKKSHPALTFCHPRRVTPLLSSKAVSPVGGTLVTTDTSEKAPHISTVIVGKKSSLQKCKICDYQTANDRLLQLHVANHEPIECPMCKSSVRVKRFTTHLIKHNAPESKFGCCYCGFDSKSFQGLLQHLANRHVRALRKHSCSECEFSSLTPSVLKRHMEAHHSEKKVSNLVGGSKASSHSRPTAYWKSASADSSTDIPEPMEPPHCKVDGDTTQRPASQLTADALTSCELKTCDKESHEGKHKRRVRRRPAETEDLKRYTKSLYTPPGSIGNWCYQCPSCNFGTMRSDLYDRHVAKHEPLVCPVCSSLISDHFLFMDHVAEHNPSNTPFKCPYCKHVPSTKPRLFYHLACHLEALRKFDCPLCEFRSNRADLLGNHLQTHKLSVLQIPHVMGTADDSPVLKKRKVSETSPVPTPSQTNIPGTESSAVPNDTNMPDQAESDVCSTRMEGESSNALPKLYYSQFHVEAQAQVAFELGKLPVIGPGSSENDDISISRVADSATDGIENHQKAECSSVVSTSTQSIKTVQHIATTSLPHQPHLQTSHHNDVQHVLGSNPDNPPPTETPLTWRDFAKFYYQNH